MSSHGRCRWDNFYLSLNNSRLTCKDSFDIYWPPKMCIFLQTEDRTLSKVNSLVLRKLAFLWQHIDKLPQKIPKWRRREGLPYGGRQRRPLQKAAPRQVWEDTIRVWRIWHFLGWDFVQPGGIQRGTPHNRLYLFMNTLGMTLDRSSNIYHKSMYSKLGTGEWPGKLSQLFLEASGDEARICLSIYGFLASLRRPGIHTPLSSLSPSSWKLR